MGGDDKKDEKNDVKKKGPMYIDDPNIGDLIEIIDLEEKKKKEAFHKSIIKERKIELTEPEQKLELEFFGKKVPFKDPNFVDGLYKWEGYTPPTCGEIPGCYIADLALNFKT